MYFVGKYERDWWKHDENWQVELEKWPIVVYLVLLLRKHWRINLERKISISTHADPICDYGYEGSQDEARAIPPTKPILYNEFAMIFKKQEETRAQFRKRPIET